MKRSLIAVFVLSLISISLLTATNNPKQVLAITSTVEGQQVEFSMAALSTNDELSLRKVETPFFIKLDESMVGGVLLEVTEQTGKIKAELLSDMNLKLSGSGKSLIITQYQDDIKVMVIR